MDLTLTLELYFDELKFIITIILVGEIFILSYQMICQEDHLDGALCMEKGKKSFPWVNSAVHIDWVQKTVDNYNNLLFIADSESF